MTYPEIGTAPDQIEGGSRVWDLGIGSLPTGDPNPVDP